MNISRRISKRGMVCVDCGSTEDITLDHIIERHYGGTDDLNNLVPRCRACNSRKSNEIRRQD